MSNKFTADLMELQTLLRQAMTVWHDHRKGIKRLEDPKGFEDLLVAANFALAEIRLDILAYEHETAELVGEVQMELNKSTALLRQAMGLFDQMLGGSTPVPSNVIVFTGDYRPVPANDAPTPGGAA